MNTIKTLLQLLRLCWPPAAIRIIRRGGLAIAQFRAEHGREPTEQEWKEIALRVEREVL